MKLRQYFEHFLEKKKLNVFWTCYLNFRFFPIDTAIKFPILCYGKIRVRSTEGKVELPPPPFKKHGVLQIGVDPTGYRTCGTTTITLLYNSKLIIGGSVKLYQGASILVGRNAELTLQDKVTVGDSAEIICMEKVFVGENTDVTWSCQVTDFASHPIIDIITEECHPMTKPVKIGRFCWIGNRTTVMPGTKLPDHIIVASNSLLNKDYETKGVKPYSMIGGIPSSILKENVERVY